MTPQPDSAAHIERDAVIARCRKLELVEDFVRMRREVLRYLAHTPDDAIALSLLARAHFRLGHPVRALAPLVRCCRHSEHFVFRLLYAHALSRVGCAEEALSQLENGARRMPETSLSFFTAGVAFEGIGETERAIRFYTRLLNWSRESHRPATDWGGFCSPHPRHNVPWTFFCAQQKAARTIPTVIST